jgi:hypothetical protein
MLTEGHLLGHEPLVRRKDMELRNVKLRYPCDRWPAGTPGVIVDAFRDDATIEISDEEGRTLDLLTLPYETLELDTQTPGG